MKKIALLLADGFEDGEALFTADVLRRAGFQCDLVGVTGARAVSSRGITVLTDRPFDEDLSSYDMLVLPGGMPGAANLRDDPRVLSLVRAFDRAGKWIGAICAAPIALKAAGITKGRRLTAYPDPAYEALFSDSDYVDETVVRDKNLITAQGPAMTLPFAYALVEALGKSAAGLREGMLYNRAMRKDV